MERVKLDISDDVEFKNGKGNPFGWSQEEIWHNGKCIGFLESGTISIYESHYSSEVIQETGRKRGIIYLEL